MIKMFKGSNCHDILKFYLYIIKVSKSIQPS
jgi:hypothetical protein